MSVVSSEFVLGHEQRDGRRYVEERFLLSTSDVITREYLAAVGADCAAILAARVPQVEATLAESEFLDRLGAVSPLGLQHQTAAAFAARLRERYRSAEREELVRFAWWIIEQIVAGNVTDAQVRTAFGLTAGQYSTLKSARLQPAHDAWAAVLAAKGE